MIFFLTDRSQTTRVNFYQMYFYLPPAALRGVSSHLLFILYKKECQSQYEGRHIKFADDSMIVSLLSNQDTDHGPVVEDAIDWCERSSLSINVLKTKEMIILLGKSLHHVLLFLFMARGLRSYSSTSIWAGIWNQRWQPDLIWCQHRCS